MGEYGLRLEDYGKQVMENLPRMEMDKIAEGFSKYLSTRMNNKYFMILSNSVGYYSVFKSESKNIEEKVKNIISFLESSRYYNTDQNNPYVEMIDIKYYELNEDHGHLELWIGKEYFQFFPFDWGVEVI